MEKYISINSLFALLILCVTFDQPANAVNYTKYDTLTFIHVTDPHVCNLTGYNHFFAEKRQHFGSNLEKFPVFLNSVPEKYRAEFVVVTGDNVDFYEAETEKGGVLGTQVEQYSDLLDNCRFPMYITLGNHDIASYHVKPGPSVGTNQLNAGRARAVWMRNVTCFKEGTYYSHVFKVDTTTFRLIFLDNSFYATEEVADGALPFIIDQYQLLWLDAQLKSSPSDVEIIFMHMPLPYGKVTDEIILTEPISVYSSKSKYYNLLSVLENNSSARLLFAGHKHINSINNYIMPDGSQLTQVMTGAFGYDIANWRLIKVTGNKIIISSPGSNKTEYSIPVK